MQAARAHRPPRHMMMHQTVLGTAMWNSTTERGTCLTQRHNRQAAGHSRSHTGHYAGRTEEDADMAKQRHCRCWQQPSCRKQQKHCMLCKQHRAGLRCCAAQNRCPSKKESLPNTVAQQSRCREQHMRHCRLCQQHMLQPQMQLRSLKLPISNRKGGLANAVAPPLLNGGAAGQSADSQ